MVSSILLKAAVRSIFFFTSQQQALDSAEIFREKYLQLEKEFTPEESVKRVRIPAMPGVDEDMRDWSYHMIVEHNVIVNESITSMITQLAKGEELHGDALIDPKKDVMPADSVDSDVLMRFSNSVSKHIEEVKGLEGLRKTKKTLHPVFGNFNAHQWNCMFTFHLRLHYNQSKALKRLLHA